MYTFTRAREFRHFASVSFRMPNPPHTSRAHVRVVTPGFVGVIAGVLVSASALAAGPDPAELERELSRLVSADRDSTATQSRLARLEAVITVRAALIDAAPDDERAPTWLLDQAAAILERAAHDGADASVLFGVPTLEQTHRVRLAADEAARFVRRADELSQSIVERVEQRIFDARGADVAASEARLGVLVDTEQAWRIPLLRARSLVLLNASDTSPEVASRIKRLEAAEATLASLRVPADRPGVETLRTLTLSAARLAMRRDRHEPTDPRPDLEQLVTRLSTDADRAGDRPAAPFELAQASAALALCARTAQEAKLAAESLAVMNGAHASPLAVLLRGEAAARACLLTRWDAGAEPARTTPEENAAWLNLALAGLVVAAEHPLPTEIKETRDAWRALVYEKIAGLVDPSAPLERVTPHAAFASALRLARESADSRADTPARARRISESLRLFKMVADRTGADAAGADLRADALWEGAAISLQSREGSTIASSTNARVEALRMLLRLAREFPSHPRRRSALEAAGDMVLAASASNATTADPDKTWAALSNEALEVAITLEPPASNDAGFRLALGQSLAQRWNRDTQTPAAADEAIRAIALLEQAASDPVLAPRADKAAASLLDDALSPGARSMLARDDRTALVAAAIEWAARRSAWRVPLYTLAAMDRATGPIFTQLAAKLQPETLEKLPAEEQSLLLRNNIRIRLGHAIAQRERAETPGAFDTLSKLVDELDREDPANPGARPREFWIGWTQLLEMLAEDNAGGERTGAIKLQLNRLKLIDRELGGEPHRSQFIAIEARVNPVK